MVIDIKVNEIPKPNKPKILQMEMDGTVVKEWDSFDDIYLEKGWRYSNIHNCCSGRLLKAYGYKWEYKKCE